MVTNNPIPNVLTDVELRHIHGWYYDASEIPAPPYQKQIVDFVNAVRHEEVVRRQAADPLFRVEYVEGQPYQSAQEMRERIVAEHVLYISTDYDNDPFLTGSNLNFRTAHDLHHSRSNHCDFELWGEICAYAKFAEYVSDWHDENLRSVICQFLFSEIVAQVVCLRLEGDYAEQRIGWQPVHIINGIHRAYGLPEIVSYYGTFEGE